MNKTTKPSILVVDDELNICELVKDILEDEHYPVTTASDVETARSAVSRQQPSLILLDIWMPDIDGITLLQEFKEQSPNTAIVMMSGHGTIETAVQATRLGAKDFIEKPLSTAKLLHSIETVLENQAKQYRKGLCATQKPIGKSPQITLLIEQAQRLAKHTMPVLLIGESGSGKHRFAHYLHALGKYTTGKFIELTAETFPLDSAKLATIINKTCLYIDNVAHLSDKAQALLIYMLESNQFVNCQLICACHHPLEQAVKNDRFRQSLFYQLNSIILSIPPLREHAEDIPKLVHHFVDEYNIQSQLPYRHFTVAAQNRLRNHLWPGNVLELKNIVQRLLLIGETDDVDVDAVDLVLQPLSDGNDTNSYHSYIHYDLSLKEAREKFERLYLLHQLQQSGGNVGKAAKLAGIERTHLYRKLRSLGIDAKQI